MRITRIYQSDVNEDIHLEYRVIDDDAARDAEAIEAGVGEPESDDDVHESGEMDSEPPEQAVDGPEPVSEEGPPHEG